MDIYFKQENRRGFASGLTISKILRTQTIFIIFQAESKRNLIGILYHLRTFCKIFYIF